MRLLLVEDDRDLARLLKKNLEKAGYAVDVSHDGIEGEYLGNEGVYELVILDLGLPQRNGMTVLKNWRAQQNGLPVLILTARDAWYEKVDGFKAGADDYLAKPFHVKELLVRINALLHRFHQLPGGDNVQVGGLILDQDHQQVVTENGKRIDLTGAEFKLLRYFLLHRGQVISKSTLNEQLYDFDSDKDSNVIEVYVNHLRRKLGKERFETRRGQGYIFKDESS
ncbi:response regulator [Methylomicrobium album]|uniref:Response regulator with CheY-like receiver domain and winged-helix DNA-binding domain n=1 Tax=Methylomicrobium album BG8 TaxID=686340 RepID=H8GI31_METAL|nr:response regulator transcription factor [Methylomicrobium album]EIC30175.1 response regulator with CheY-like receiver domain and winged-helix DNA-binding domain [Methylomicrobium album BG8]